MGPLFWHSYFGLTHLFLFEQKTTTFIRLMVFQAAQLEVALNDKNYCISATIDRVLDRGYKQSFYGHSQYISVKNVNVKNYMIFSLIF